MTDVADVKPTVTGTEIKSISTPAKLFPYRMQTRDTCNIVSEYTTEICSNNFNVL